jgi:hypothetical protein
VAKKFNYERTPTDAKMRVTMPDGTLYDVPVQAIADNRDDHYRDDKEDTVGFIRAGKLDQYEIEDWAANNMNWSDVAKRAVKVDAPVCKTDLQEGWVNGDKEIIGKI